MSTGDGLLLNPGRFRASRFDPETRELLLKTIEFFEKRGKARLKADDHARVWYADFIEFQKREKLFATFLTPSRDGGSRYDLWRINQLNEILGFYGLSYWYTWQVTQLGLGPIWMSTNEDARRRTAEALRNGGIFAFGLSEKEHGADLYSSEMKLETHEGGAYVARGRKYYIGNGNAAALVSTFAKIPQTGEFVFFVVEPAHERYECVKNVLASQNYVAEYALHDYPIGEKDILSRGPAAWDAALNTINVCKYNLGWAAIGICTHALHEAIDHASSRRLFNSQVTDFPHIRQYFVDAYARLSAMKLFALRASDYFRSASAGDRRYLLYNPLVKMKVTTQGEEVIDLLWDIIAAKGFEKDMYFECATRDIRALPKLEGTVHVNMALVIKFMKNYFFDRARDLPVPGRRAEPVNDDFLFAQGPTKGLGRTRFHDYRMAYDSVKLPNVSVFKGQIRDLRLLLLLARPNAEQVKDFDFLLTLGELFTLVVYGQLIIESAKLEKTSDDLLDQIFDFIVRDFSKFALKLRLKPSATPLQRAICTRMLREPRANPKRFARVWDEQVFPLRNTYAMAEKVGPTF